MDRYGVLRRRGECAWAAWPGQQVHTLPCPCGAQRWMLEAFCQLPCRMLDPMPDAGSHARSHARSHASKLPEVPEFPQLPAARQASPARGSLGVNRGALIRPGVLRPCCPAAPRMEPEPTVHPAKRKPHATASLPTASLPSTEATALSCQGVWLLLCLCFPPSALCRLLSVVCVVSCSEFVSRREAATSATIIILATPQMSIVERRTSKPKQLMTK